MTPKTVVSPLEEIFNIDNGTTELAIGANSVVPSDLIEMDSIDEQEDQELATQTNTIFNYAMEAYEQQSATIQTIDPKYAARTAEVAAQYLNIALNAVNVRGNNRDRREKRKGTPSQNAEQINNIIVTDRNELLKLMRSGDNKND